MQEDTALMTFINSIITPELIRKVLNDYILDPLGIHGISHWIQVEQNACRLAQAEGIQSDVFSLFALFHDSRRINDGRDKDHGVRGAALARNLQGKWFQLSKMDLEILCYACENHTRQTHHRDPIIGICFDSDRLDLPRVGIATDIRYLNSVSAMNEVLSLNP
jgi:uncharacterized protein